MASTCLACWFLQSAFTNKLVVNFSSYFYLNSHKTMSVIGIRKSGIMIQVFPGL